MRTFTKLTAIVSALGFASSAVAAPVNGTTTSDLEARAPYDVHNSWASWYNAFAGIGACGWQNHDKEWVAAVGTALFQEIMVDGSSNHSKACGKTANVSWNGKTIKVGIVDRCYACGYNDIDLSPSAFQQFSGLGTGKLYGVSWKFD
ncbi:hypothetical protein FRC11_001261 [Ceratobasidium sp. 423]|nr:hypothetical protein FRC11_001261 [Ceratobasidium sp. 423]